MKKQKDKWQNICRMKGLTHEKLAEMLEITRPTLYKRVVDNKWKKSQIITLKTLGIL